ncbi:MAG: phosphopantetheine adenylyltransferase, partial [Methanomicrobiales archaeon]
YNEDLQKNIGPIIMPSHYEKVAVGGTFDKFHKGHEKLLEKAFEIGEKVIIGVTSDEFGGQKGDVESCATRMSNLNNFLEDYPGKYKVMRLTDPYGTTIYDKTFDAIVVSRETEKTALEINKIRKNNGMEPLAVIVIDIVMAEDGEPISSTRIRKGEINMEGEIITDTNSENKR